MTKTFFFILLFVGQCGQPFQKNNTRQIAVEKNDAALVEMLKGDSISALMALNLLDQAIAADCTFITAYRNKVRCLCMLNRYLEAISLADYVQKLQPKKTQDMIFQAMLFEKAGLPNEAQMRYEKSLEYYDERIKFEPNNFDAKLDRAFLLLFFEKARGIEAYRKLLSEAPDRVDSTYWSDMFYSFDKNTFLRDLCK